MFNVGLDELNQTILIALILSVINNFLCAFLLLCRVQVYVEFDDQEWDKREWVKVYEDFQLFLLEHQLVWAKRKEGAAAAGGGGAGGLLQGSKAKHIQWPALVRPVFAIYRLGTIMIVASQVDYAVMHLPQRGAPSILFSLDFYMLLCGLSLWFCIKVFLFTSFSINLFDSGCFFFGTLSCFSISCQSSVN